MIRANTWTAEEEAWLREVYPHHSNADLAMMHAEKFPDRPRRSAKAINSRGKVYRIHKADGFVRNPPTFWTDGKLEWFRSFVPGHSESEISAEHERIYGEPLTEGQIGNAKARFGIRSGTVGGRFRKGMAPANKGKTWAEMGISEESQARCRATCFKKGEVHVAPSRKRPIGYERTDRDGYVMVKVRDSEVDGIQRQERGRVNENYRLKHHVVWEQANDRPVPPSTMIVFADRDKLNFDPENLVAVPRSLWSVISRQGYSYSDRESLEACIALAELNSKVYKAQCRPRECRKCGTTFEARYPNQRTCDRCLGR